MVKDELIEKNSINQLDRKTFELNGYEIIPIYHPSHISPMSYKGNIEIFKNLNIKGSDKNE